jgi:hypothetical protein
MIVIITAVSNCMYEATYWKTICFHVYIKVNYEWQVNKYYIQQSKKVEFLPVVIAE